MTDQIRNAANKLAQAADADVLLINSGMDRGVDTTIIERFAKRTAHRSNAVVLLVTSGGDADVAYRIARCLQRRYRNITGVISGYCKSAGTLLAIGAHELAFSDHGELGPLDVQLRKADDMWAATSGLTVMNAFTALQLKSEEAFADFALSIKARSSGSITFKTAADIAQKLTVGLFAHIYQQVEAMHVGEAARAMNIAEEYGARLNEEAGNLADADSLGTLVAGYPSHSFVIDMREAQQLFKNVRELSAHERELCDMLEQLSRFPSDRLNEPLYFLSDALEQTTPARQAPTNETQQADPTDSAGQEPAAQGAAETAAPTAPVDEVAGAQVVQFPAAAAPAG
jgi:Serine dehydrogenase proteinase